MGNASLFGRWPPLHRKGIDSLSTSPYFSTSNPDGVSLFKSSTADFQQNTSSLDYLLINLCVRLRSVQLGTMRLSPLFVCLYYMYEIVYLLSTLQPFL